MPEPKIEYPRTWAFKVIGEDPGRILEAIGRVLADREYECEPSNLSRTGKYRSFSLHTRVESEQDRDRVFFALRDDEAVTVVL